jgi:hypothetical protein
MMISPLFKILPVCGPRPGFRVAVLPDLVCAYLDGFLVVNVAVFGPYSIPLFFDASLESIFFIGWIHFFWDIKKQKNNQ